MKPRTKAILALTVATPAAIALAVCVAMLAADYANARRQEPIDKQRLERLEEAAGQDIAKLPALTAELDRATKASLNRVAKQRALTRVLIVAVVVFLIGAKWLVSLRRPRGPTQETAEKVRGVLSVRTKDADRGAKRHRTPAPRDPQVAQGPPPSGPDGPLDLSFVDELVRRQGRGKEAAIPILQAIQAHYRYLPDEALTRVCQLTEISPEQIAGVSSFYAQFRRSPVGKHVVKVCLGTACHVARAREIVDELRRYLMIAPDADTDPSRLFTIDEVACLGCCSLAPVIMIDSDTVGMLTPVSACEAIQAVQEDETS
jgi:NADH:ubiquinone oxidoreductase subunit E